MRIADNQKIQELRDVVEEYKKKENENRIKIDEELEQMDFCNFLNELGNVREEYFGEVDILVPEKEVVKEVIEVMVNKCPYNCDEKQDSVEEIEEPKKDKEKKYTKDVPTNKHEEHIDRNDAIDNTKKSKKQRKPSMSDKRPYNKEEKNFMKERYMYHAYDRGNEEGELIRNNRSNGSIFEDIHEDYKKMNEEDPNNAFVIRSVAAIRQQMYSRMNSEDELTVVNPTHY